MGTRLTGAFANPDRNAGEEMGRLERRITEEFSRPGSEFDKLYRDIATEPDEMRAELIRWMFVLSVGYVSAVTAILCAFFRR